MHSDTVHPKGDNMEDRTYSLSIKGEQHSYSVEAWQALSFDQLCVLLSDLTGYKAEHLKTKGIEFDRLGYATIEPAISGGYGGVPTFHVRSSDGGGKPC